MDYFPLLDNTAARFFTVFFLTDGIGWILASRYADERTRFLRVGYCAVLSGLLFLVSWLLPTTVPADVRTIALALAGAFSLTGIFRYFVWDHGAKSLRTIERRLKARRTWDDFPEVLLLAVVWLITLGPYGQALFTGWSGLCWTVGGLIATVRTFDRPAAVGIASHHLTRNILAWTTRISMALAVILCLTFTVHPH